MFGEDSPQPGAQRRALPFFSDDRLEHLDVESLVGNELLEPPILLFELLQPPRLVDLHDSELRFPAVEGGRRDAQFPANVLHLHAGVGLFERVDDLFLGVPALPHEPYPTRLGSRFAWSTFRGQGHSSFSIDSWTIRGVSGEEFAVREFGNSWLVRPVAFQLIPPPPPW